MLVLTRSEVAKHTTINNCWVIINDNVYDVTEFLKKHPGGAKIILAHAGRDATEAFESFHKAEIIDQNLGPGYIYPLLIHSMSTARLIKTQVKT